jgi:hypothetical protein
MIIKDKDKDAGDEAFKTVEESLPKPIIIGVFRWCG